MGDKNKNRDYKVQGNIIAVIKQNTKKGKIRGKNKKATKILRGACPHHTITDKNKLKKLLIPDPGYGKGVCRCKLCDAKVKMKAYTKEEVRKGFEGAIEIVDNMKFLAFAVNAGADAAKFATELGSMLAIAPKYYKQISNIAVKGSKVRNNRKNRKKENYTSVGMWY